MLPGQEMRLFRPPAWGHAGHHIVARASEDGARFPVAAQAGGAPKLRQQVEQRVDGVKGRFGGVELLHAGAIRAGIVLQLCYAILPAGAVLSTLNAPRMRTRIPAPERGRRKWGGCKARRDLVYPSRQRVGGERGCRLMIPRGELVERSSAQMYGTGAVRRIRPRGRENILNWPPIHSVAFNLALLPRKQQCIGKPGTPSGRAWSFAAGF
jgi:hypothetical protein